MRETRHRGSYTLIEFIWNSRIVKTNQYEEVRIINLKLGAINWEVAQGKLEGLSR